MKKKLIIAFFIILPIFLISSSILFFKVYTQYKKNEEIYKTKLENPPLISVIMPIYNRKEYINKAIDSVLNQSYNNLEIIFVDDHSTDGTYEILQQYAKKDKRIKLFRNEKNMHVSFTRNVGIKNSTGKYLYFIDSDDWIDKRYIEEMVLYAEKYNLDIINNKIFYNTRNEKKINFLKKYLLNNKKIDKKLFAQKHSSVCIKLFKKEIQEKNNIFFTEDLYFSEDIAFVKIFLLHTDKIKIINSNNTYYRRIKHGNSIIQNEDLLNKLKKSIYTYNIIKEYMKNNNIKDDNERFISISRYFLREFKDDDKVKEAYQLTRKHFKEIEDDVLKNKYLYDSSYLMLFKNILKFDNYNDFKKSYNIKVVIMYAYIIVFILFILILMIYTLKKIIIPYIMLISIFRNKDI